MYVSFSWKQNFTVSIYILLQAGKRKFWFLPITIQGFLGGSVDKESTCNAGDTGSIPGSGRSAGEVIGYPPQFSWASLVAQLVKNLPAAWETWVQSLGWEDPLEKETATDSSILAWRIPWTEESGGYSLWGHKESDMTEWLKRRTIDEEPEAASGLKYMKAGTEAQVCLLMLLCHLLIQQGKCQAEISQGEDQQIEPRVPLEDTCLLVRIV